ncbi:MAG: hypothetical protein PHU27_10440, partial [Salinivirgaceae bacterium]|nr:hypothetical protein [Salinivirgaceae bacterium]
NTEKWHNLNRNHWHKPTEIRGTKRTRIATGFLFKENAMEEIETALNRIAKGQQYISPKCNHFVV